MGRRVTAKHEGTHACALAIPQVDPVDDDDLTHINLLKYEPEHEQQIIVEVPFRVINTEKSPGVKRGGMLNVVMPKVSYPSALTPPRSPPNKLHTVCILRVESTA